MSEATEANTGLAHSRLQNLVARAGACAVVQTVGKLGVPATRSSMQAIRHSTPPLSEARCVELVNADGRSAAFVRIDSHYVQVGPAAISKNVAHDEPLFAVAWPNVEEKSLKARIVANIAQAYYMWRT